jgi:hypothetical protein
MQIEINEGTIVAGLDTDGKELTGTVMHVGDKYLKLHTGCKIIAETAQPVMTCKVVEVDLLQPMGAEEARSAIRWIKQAVNNVRSQLLELRDREGWKALGYTSWRECVNAEFEQHQSYLYRQLAAAEMEQQLSPSGDIGQIPEAHLRPLAKVPEAERPKVWSVVVESAPDGKLTGQHTAKVVRLMGYGEEPPKPSKLERVMPPLLRDSLALFFPNGYELQPDDPYASWGGSVLCWPGRDSDYWAEKLLFEGEKNPQGQYLGLFPAQTDTDWMKRLRQCDRCFIHTTIGFARPMVLVYQGRELTLFAETFSEIGDVFRLIPLERF